MQLRLLSFAIACAIGVQAHAARAADTTAADTPADAAQSETPPLPAHPTGESAQLETISVTARRRSENIEKVPVAISAFSEEDLKDLQASNIDGLQGAVPGLNVVQGRGSSSAVNVFIRGIGQPDALQTFDPGVGMYVDDIYYSRIQGALISLFDVDHVEVLRGPQGTLYGKNSTGGAIKIQTRDPSEATTGSVEGTLGDYGRAEGRFYLSGSFDERWSASIAGAIVGNDGYVRDPVTRQDYNDDDTKAVRAKLQFKPGEDFKATLALDYTRQTTALTLGEPTAPLIQSDFALGAVVLLPPSTREYDFKSRTSFAPDQGQSLTHKGASLHLDWKLSDAWTLKSISAYRRLNSASYIDIDASQFQLGDVFVGFRQKQASQELQLQYDNGSNLQAVYGLYWLRETVPSHQEAYADDLFALGGAPIKFLRTIDDDLRTTSYAGFAHLNWEFVPSWTLAAGLRWTRESKDYDRSTSIFWNPQIPPGLVDGTLAFSGKQDWTAWTPSISLQKQVNDQVMAYVSANRGFKSGGFNGRANSAAEAASAVFDPEFVWTYEIGLKMRSADGRLQGNIAAFHSDYKDFQARVSEVLNPGSPTPTFAFPVLNAAKLKMDGLEFEGAALLGQGTRLSGQLTYLDARYDKFVDPRVQIDPNLASLHAHVPFSPKWSARVALTQTFNLADGGAVTLGGDVSYRDDTWLSVDNRPGLMQDAYTLVGLFGVYDSADGHWQVRAGVRNLTDKTYKTDGQEFSSVGNIQTAYYGWPRNYYVSARYSF
ncbi:TonB-dependent receptor [Dokdonella ginsengisoli]|uniref:TonB-dependent receptor n=1 Tax=Dokdonella ginsengisoli TaxID=363846 RepID=A0ABV9QSQ8_9GAMM